RRADPRARAADDGAGLAASAEEEVALDAKQRRNGETRTDKEDRPMCGIVGAIAERNVTPILMEGLRRLEYRGYDSAGLAVLCDGELKRLRRLGKVQQLQDALDQEPLRAPLGIAHTRWATHGVPSEANAHPHVSGGDLAVVHNGIVENHEVLRAELLDAGYEFTSQTDTEVVV